MGKAFLWVFLLACLISVAVAAFLQTDGYQWDFRTYYDASLAMDRGLNPYQRDALIQVNDGVNQPLRFVYPLSALTVLKPITRLDYATAARLWLVLKLAALIALVTIWRRFFLPETSLLWIATITIVGFQAATLWDFKAGHFDFRTASVVDRVLVPQPFTSVAVCGLRCRCIPL